MEKERKRWGGLEAPPTDRKPWQRPNPESPAEVALERLGSFFSRWRYPEARGCLRDALEKFYKSDFEGSIAAGRLCVESLLKTILEEKGVYCKEMGVSEALRQLVKDGVVTEPCREAIFIRHTGYH
jgi:hypothetical protein